MTASCLQTDTHFLDNTDRLEMSSRDFWGANLREKILDYGVILSWFTQELDKDAGRGQRRGGLVFLNLTLCNCWDGSLSEIVTWQNEVAICRSFSIRPNGGGWSRTDDSALQL